MHSAVETMTRRMVDDSVWLALLPFIHMLVKSPPVEQESNLEEVTIDFEGSGPSGGKRFRGGDRKSKAVARVQPMLRTVKSQMYESKNTYRSAAWWGMDYTRKAASSMWSKRYNSA